MDVELANVGSAYPANHKYAEERVLIGALIGGDLKGSLDYLGTRQPLIGHLGFAYDFALCKPHSLCDDYSLTLSLTIAHKANIWGQI
jgi:hypothetical protein